MDKMTSTTQPHSSDERTWAALAHASTLLNFVVGMGGTIGAGLIWLIKREESEWVAFHGLQALVFQGLVLVAMLIAYLPTMYSAFSQRETAVAMLEVRAGWPPTAPELIWRLHGMQSDASDKRRFWESWEAWFTEIDESHTSLAALVFFRSPRAGQSWVLAARVALDAAALQVSAVDEPFQVHPSLAMRAGILALRHIADFFKVSYNPDPHFPQDPIGVARAEFDAAYDRLNKQGVPMKADRDLAWRNFAGWRVNYDGVLAALTRLTMAPDVSWLAEFTFAPPDSDSGETAGQLKKAS